MPLEVVAELWAEAAPDFDAVASELSKRLWGNPIAVRGHRGSAEDERLVRVLTARGNRGQERRVR